MNTMTKTYHQLTEVFKLYQKSDLSPYHPLINELVKLEDIIDELHETRDDLKYAKDKGGMEEEVEDLEEVVQELEDLEYSVARLAMGRLSGRPRRSLLR